MNEIRIGSRGSALARWQTNWVVSRLQQAWPGLTFPVTYFTTSGDRIQDRPLPTFGGKGVFTDDLARALQSREIDVAVHSLKDLPVEEIPGLTVAAICERADARDVLVAAAPLFPPILPAPVPQAQVNPKNGGTQGGQTLQTLPDRARVGTSSLRRSAQLLAARPDLTLLPIRGNIDTRIRKALGGEYDVVVLAAAGLLRLGLGEHIVETLPFDVMLPAPGQGAVAVQCRVDEQAVIDTLLAVEHIPTRQAVSAERAFLKALGGGCSAPIGAYGKVNEDGKLELRGLVASLDGQKVIRVSGAGDDPDQLGVALAQEALELGAGVLLS